MTGAVGDGVVWPPARSPWAVWADPPSLQAVLAGGRESAVVSVWASLRELAGGGLGYAEVLGALGVEAGGVELERAGLGAPVRFLAAALEAETSRVAQAALWLGSAIDQLHRSAPSDAEIAGARAAAAHVAAALGVDDLQPAPAQGLCWLWAALERGAGRLEEVRASPTARAVRPGRNGDLTHNAFLLGAVEDGGWPSTAEHLGFPVAWCVRRVPEVSTIHGACGPAIGIIAVAGRTLGQLEARVEQLQDAYRVEGRVLVRPREQLALAAAMAPWSRLSRRLWRRATRSVLAGA